MAGFFTKSNEIDIITTYELLLRKYDINFINSLDYQEGFELIKKAFDVELESKLWDKWLVDYQHMNKDNFISFEEYRNSVIPTDNAEEAEISDISDDELLNKALEIQDKIEGRRK